MGPTRSQILLAVVLILLIILLSLRPRVRDLERHLTGFWVGEPNFVREAGLSEIYLYIAPQERKCRQGYLVMVGANGEMISNQGIELSYGNTLGRWISALKSANRASARETYRVRGKITYDVKRVMPESLTLGLHLTNSTLTLYDSTKVYAHLIRDNEASLGATQAYKATSPSN